MPSYLDDLTNEALMILHQAQAETDEFAERTGIRCREGCGQCCLKPGIEVQVVEMLPLAKELLEKGEADNAYDKAAQDPEGRCIFYSPNQEDESKGSCLKYHLRPSLCRLFGFAAVNTKARNSPALAACYWHKKLQPEEVKKAQSTIDQGAKVPIFADYRMQFYALAPSQGFTQIMPINRALMIAIEKAELHQRRMKD